MTRLAGLLMACSVVLVFAGCGGKGSAGRDPSSGCSHPCGAVCCAADQECVNEACVPQENATSCASACGTTTPFCDNGACKCQGSSCGDGFTCNASGACELIVPACNPLSASSCGAGASCYSHDSNFECQPTGLTAVGSACSATNRCVLGADCVSSVCRSYCDLANPVCSSSDVCVASTSSLGYCVQASNQNNLCSAAIALKLGVPISGDTTAATSDYGDTLSSVCYAQTSFDAQGPELVYSYTPATDAMFAVTVTPASGYDTLLWVSTSPCDDGGACIAAADAGARGEAEEVYINGSAGTRYYIYVDSFNSTASTCRGGFSIQIMHVPSCNPLKPNCGPTEGCYFFVDDMFTCQPAGGVAVGSSCTSTNSCVPGALCVNGYCYLPCSSPGGANTCTAPNECRPTDVSGIGFCWIPPPGYCNPLHPTCGTGQGCFGYSYMNGDTYTCQTAGTVPSGSACNPGRCVAGTDCVQDSTGTKCRPYCDPKGTVPPPACVDPLSCYDWGDGTGSCAM